MRILVVEDEEVIADAIATKLRAEKYEVDTCFDGEEGLDKALDDIYDLIMLDIMLPKTDGLTILREIKERGIRANVTKPFHIEELVARVNANLRNENRKSRDILEFGDLSLDIRTSTLVCTVTGESIHVPYREFLVLEYLMNHKTQIVSRMQIYDSVWGIDNDFESNNLEAYLSFLRRKIKIIGSHVKIKAVRNLGYRLIAE